MDSTSSEALSQVFSKLLFEFYKQQKIVKEVSSELQSLTTALYHTNKDCMNLVRHSARQRSSRDILEDQMLKAFKSTTKYTRLFIQLEDVIKQFYGQFMKEKYPGLQATGKPCLRLDFSDVKFTGKIFYILSWSYTQTIFI